MSTRLPFTLTPLPGEPFDLWWHSYATALGVTNAELACAVGIPHADAAPGPRHVTLIAAATGLASQHLTQLFISTRPNPPAHVLRVWSALTPPIRDHRLTPLPPRLVDLLARLRNPGETGESREQTQAELTDLTLIALHLTQAGITRLHGFTNELPDAATFAAAIEVFTEPGATAVPDRLGELVARRADRRKRNRLAVPFSWRTASPTLLARIAHGRDSLISPVERLRHATTLPRPHIPRRQQMDPAHSRAGRLPDQLWPSWAIRLSDDDAIDNTVFRSAMIAALLLPHSTLTLGQIGALLPQQLSAFTIAHQLRRLERAPAGSSALRILTELALALDIEHVPIGYPRRRRIAATLTLIDQSCWNRLCAESGVRSGAARRLNLVRCHLYELITGGNLATAPHRYRLAEGTPRINYIEFCVTMPARLAAALRVHAQTLLAATGIHDEPLTWQPPTDWVSRTAWPGADPERTDPGPIHLALLTEWAATSNGHWSIQPVADTLGISSHHLRQVLRCHPIAEVPYRQHRPGSIIAIPSAGGRGHRIDPRPGDLAPIFHVDPTWLREQYLTYRRTLRHIAAEIGCGRETLRSFADAHGIPVRPRSGSTTHIPTETINGHPADLPDLLRNALTGQQSRDRLERFLLITEHPSLGRAAASIGIGQNNLTNQLHVLERACGGQLLHRRSQPHPIGPLTELGQQLRQQAQQHLTLEQAALT